MAARRVLCRAGRSRGPPTRRANLLSSLLRSKSSGRSLIRLAANSIASGSPSNREQIAATISAFSAVRANPESASSALRANSSMAGYATNCSGESNDVGSGKTRGGTSICRSPRTRKRPRLVTSTFNIGHSSSNRATSGAASITCSMLSSTSSAFFPERLATRVSRSESAPLSLKPSTRAVVGRTNSGSSTAASPTK
jgi:hypothetical protein